MPDIKCSIPNAITCLNLLSGCAAIVLAFHAYDRLGPLYGLEWCFIAIGCAAIFDFCDGASARALGAYSQIGKDLDSLSDLISFGVAPAMLVVNVMLHYSSLTALCYTPLLLAAFGAMRLAKFNNDPEQTSEFRGLPIPANAIFWLGVVAWIEKYAYPGTPVLILLIGLMCAAMVGNFRMFSLKFKNFNLRENFRRYMLLAAAALFVVCYGLSGLAWSILLYFLLSLHRRNYPV